MEADHQTKTGAGLKGAGRLRVVRVVIARVFINWFADDVPHYGAALAFYTIFSAAPISIIVIAVAGSVYGPELVEQGLLSQVERLTGSGTAEFLGAMIQSARQSRSGFATTVLGFAMMFLGATAFFGELQNALNKVWNVGAEIQGIFWSVLIKRLLSFLMVLLAGVMFVFMLLANAVLTAMHAYMAGWIPGWALISLRASEMLISFLLSSVLFAAIYKVLPDARIAWRDVWVGAFVTSILFNLGRLLIGLYLGRESLASAYGAAGAFVLLLFWVYYSAQVVLLGAEFTKVYARTCGKGFSQKERRYLRPSGVPGGTASHPPSAL
jgi:membrane protein